MSEEEKYENLIGEKVEAGDASFDELFGADITTTVSQNWKDHWKGMPDFEQEKETKASVTVNFRSEEDYKKFQELIGVKVAPKSKSCWWPAVDEDANFLHRWVENDES